MNPFKSAKIVSILAMANLVFFANFCLAADTELEQALADANIMPKLHKFKIVEESSQVTVQTHENFSSKDPVKDCKINAILIAKLVFEKKTEAARVRIMFYNRDNSAYKQVVVTVGDVSAFGAGKLSQEKLLDSLAISDGSTGAKKTAAASATAAAATNPPVLDSSSNLFIFHSNGISLRYPGSWSFTPKSDNGFFGDIGIPGNSNWTIISLRLQNAPSAQQQAQWDEKYLLERGHKVTSKEPKAKVGPSGSESPGYGESFENKDQNGVLRTEHHIYFGDAGRIYTMNLACPKADQARMEPLFQKVLKTVGQDF